MSSLDDRMKDYYEHRSKTYLTRRTPVIIRLDGKAFHSFTKGFKRPYDKILHTVMNKTTQYLCENIQGCKLGYTQSDEITLLLTDYDKLDTDAWFGYAVQKLCSVAASMATMAFNRFLGYEYEELNRWVSEGAPSEEDIQYMYTVYDKLGSAMFDARCFNIPKEEVANCFIWRQQDATRNAIQMLGQTCFSHKQLDNKSTSDIQDMLMLEKGINFNDMPIAFKRGVCCYKTTIVNIDVDMESREETRTERSNWVIDEEIPIFTQDRHYIERWVFI